MAQRTSFTATSTRLFGTLGLVAMLVQAPPAFAVERCSARIDQKTGAVLVNATGLAGTPTWSGSTGTNGVEFADAADCIVGNRLRRCHLGAPGTLAEMTPPAECRVCVHDDAEPCCAFLKGCTPGPRLKDASFTADDPRVCQGGGATDPACGPVGSWERTSGLLQLGYATVSDLVVLDVDGTARLSSRDDNGALRCSDALYTKGGGNEIVLDPASGGPKVLRFRLPDSDALELVDARGRSSTYVRRESPPAELTCRRLQVVSQLDGLPLPTFDTGLAFDGTLVWYTNDAGDEVSVDPASGAAGTTLSLPGIVQAAQGATFWMKDATANRAEAVRVERNAAPVDVVTTPGAAGDAPFVISVAVDVARDLAFLATTSPSGDAHPLLPVLTGVEPDQFQAANDVGQDLKGLAFDGASLWAISRLEHLFRIDPASGVVLETFVMPDDGVHFVAVAIVNGDLVLLGASFQGQQAPTGVLVRVRE